MSDLQYALGVMAGGIARAVKSRWPMVIFGAGVAVQSAGWLCSDLHDRRVFAIWGLAIQIVGLLLWAWRAIVERRAHRALRTH